MYTRCSMQCVALWVAVCCRVFLIDLQCVLQGLAVTCSVLQFVPECCGMLQRAAVFECVAVTCSVLQCAAGLVQCATACCYVCRVCCSDLKRVVVCVAVSFSVSPCGAVCCNALQFVSV